MRPFRILIFFSLLAALIAAGRIFFPQLLDKEELVSPVYIISDHSLVRPDSTFSPDSLALPDSSLFIPSDSLLPVADTTAEPLSDTTDPLHSLLPSDTTRGKVRVMVFGDSQLEGDRFTSRMRSRLRNVYGGSGPGLLQPLMPVMYTRSVELRSSSRWTRYNYLSFKAGTISHREIGPFMSMCRFLPPDSVSMERVTATIRITPSVYADSSTTRYDNFRLFYGNLNGECIISVGTPGGNLDSDTLIQGAGPYEYSFKTGTVSDLRIAFNGFASPDIYAFSIEGDSGIIVDNIPHRGSAGLEFTMADKKNLTDLLEKMDPQLIILQYGLNVVRNLNDDYTYYQRGLERQISLLKEIRPESKILLMSLTDMATDFSGTISSYPNIDKIRDAQKRAADSQSIAFWDTWEAMGGVNSIVAWAVLDPPLAHSDYTHLTYTGSDSVAMMLLDDLTVEPLPKDTAVLLDTTYADTTVAMTGVDSTVLTKIENRTDIVAAVPEKPGLLIWHSIISYDPGSPFIFTNLAFWIFMLVLLTGYSIIYKKGFIRNFYLLIFSLFFYYKSGGFYLVLLIVSTLVDYTASHLIYRSGTTFPRRFWLIISLCVNLGMLAYFKYFGFIIESVNNIAGTSIPAVDVLSGLSNDLLGTSFDISSIILPVGISFFTFQTMSYTIDVYRGKIEPVRNIADFGFYVSFFPQLVAGPIVRASEFIPQLYAKFSLTKREFGHALFLIMKGLIKKMIISDFISTNFVDRVFNSPELYSGAENLLSVYGYGLQIYCDFSGYTDIAIGIALLLGFRLPFNFNSPYKATSVADFWKRWHISLSRWLKDYLYISLGGNRRGSFRTGMNLIITMALGGLWHGASGRFIVWGLLHGAGLIVNKIWGYLFPSPLRKMKLITLIQIFLTFNFISFTWIFFRAESNSDALLIINKIFTGFETAHLYGIWESYTAVILVMILGYIFHFLPGRVKESARGLFVQSHIILQFIAALLVAVILIRTQSTDIQPFIYFRF